MLDNQRYRRGQNITEQQNDTQLHADTYTQGPVQTRTSGQRGHSARAHQARLLVLDRTYELRPHELALLLPLQRSRKLGVVKQLRQLGLCLDAVRLAGLALLAAEGVEQTSPFPVGLP